MDKDKILDEIFNNDPLGLLKINPKNSGAKTADERLLASFLEINDFFEKNKREPEANISNISEFQLYSRLKNLREDDEKIEQLKPSDIYNLLHEASTNQVNEPKARYRKIEKKEINSIDDFFDDDSLNLLDDDSAGLFDFKHTPKIDERASAEFIAKRKPCKNFSKYEQLLKDVQKDLSEGKRKLIDFKQKNLKVGAFYVHNGVLFYLEKINISQKEHYKDDGTRVREDGRTRCIFENGTESNMLKRSVEKILYENGKVVTENFDKINDKYLQDYSGINKDDKESGYIYVLKSKSKNKEIQAIENLYKIGYSTTEIPERIKNAAKEPTYLMADVEYISGWKCYNMSTQKFEQLIHTFFGNSCLEVDVFDKKRKRHTPREWFIAPIEVIEKAIELIISGDIVGYKYDVDNRVIVGK